MIGDRFTATVPLALVALLAGLTYWLDQIAQVAILAGAEDRVIDEDTVDGRIGVGPPHHLLGLQARHLAELELDADLLAGPAGVGGVGWVDRSETQHV